MRDAAAFSPPGFGITIDGIAQPEHIGILIARDVHVVATSDLSRTAGIRAPWVAYLTRRNAAGVYKQGGEVWPGHVITAVGDDGRRVEFDTTTGSGSYSYAPSEL